MYLGRIVEIAGQGAAVLRAPRHPYTRMLLDAIPDIHMSGRARTPVQGEVPNPLQSARGLRLQSALPACQRALPGERPMLLPSGASGSPATRSRKGGSEAGEPLDAGAAQASGRRCSPRIWSAALSRSRTSHAWSPLTSTSAARGAGVVVARHAHRIGAGREDGDVRRRAHGERPVAAEPVAGLADRADDVERPAARPGRARIRRSASRRRTSPAAPGRSSPRRRCRSSSSRRA